MIGLSDSYSAERNRILVEYQRRAAEIGDDRYAPWQPAEAFMRAGRERTASRMLREAGVFPVTGDKCLEIGYGRVGWLGTLISWGLCESDLSGIELDENRARLAQTALPTADLRVGDATRLHWPDNTFRLVICSTVLTSILDQEMRRQVADEITRVLATGGALLWYDFRFNNPQNQNVRKVDHTELRRLFPRLKGKAKAVTLAPPLARLLAPRSLVLATILERVPWFRTHLLAALLK